MTENHERLSNTKMHESLRYHKICMRRQKNDSSKPMQQLFAKRGASQTSFEDRKKTQNTLIANSLLTRGFLHF